jgi:hypothetical protein
MAATRNVRDYGYGEPDVRGAPRVKEILKDNPKCPNCGCATLALCEVDVVNPLLKGGHGTGLYMGCPACPWASPMMATAAGPAKGDA